MKLQRLWAISRKEFRQISRDPRSLGLAFGLPLTLLIIFGYALSLDVDRVPLAVWDQCQDTVSRNLISLFQGSRYFSVSYRVTRYDEIDKLLESRKAMAALVIPSDFSRRVERGAKAKAQFILDGSDANTATIALGYAESIALGYSQSLTFKWLKMSGQTPKNALIDMKARVWYNDDLESKNFIVPGIMAVILMLIAALLIPLSVAREWETGTMEQLISTPIKGSELVLGKLFPYFCIGMIDVCMAILVGRYVFLVPLRGSLALLLVTAALYLTGGLSLGLCLSIVTKSQLAASQAALLLSFLPAFMLSGFISPISQMPPVIKFITCLFPARYFVTILKGIYMKGIGISELSFEISMLSLYTFCLLTLCIKKFQKRLI
ncbi:MAG: ABC transporter permease [Candidatus Riflebacteria bacterium]|nr:ABC transporter permease [Candidatus Riflebacteria bacterium]